MKTKMIEIWTNNRVGKNTQTNLQCLLKGLCRQKEGGGVIIKWMGALQLTTKILNKGVTNHKSSPTPLLIGLFCIGVVVYYGVIEGGGGGLLTTLAMLFSNVSVISVVKYYRLITGHTGTLCFIPCNKTSDHRTR